MSSIELLYSLWAINSILIFFFMKTSRAKLILFIYLFLTMISSHIVLHNAFQQVSLAFLILLTALPFILFIHRPYYMMISSFIISISYAAILLWERISPIWFILAYPFLISLFISCIIIILVKPVYKRIIALTIGMTIGEIIDGLVLHTYHLQKQIGSLYFLQNLFLSLLILLSIHLLHRCYIKAFSRKQTEQDIFTFKSRKIM